MTLTKAMMAEKLTDEIGLNKRESKEFLDSFFDEMRSTLIGGEDVKLTGFGNFSIRDKRERPGRNPKTGEAAVIAARRVVTFKTGQKLKMRIEEVGTLISKL
jgi:integration host factor subunit alpha